MEYFETDVDVLRSQVKANRTYKEINNTREISNLFKQNSSEVRRGFSERNLRFNILGPVVQKPVNANLGLKVNQGFFFYKKRFNC